VTAATPTPRVWGFSPKRLLPEPPRHRRVAKSAPPQQDRLGVLLEEWLAEQRIGYTYEGD
jgi:hypothetical protein